MIVAFLENPGFVSHAKSPFFICKQELNSRGDTLKHIFLLCAGWGGFLSLTGLGTVLSVGAPAHCGSSGIAGPPAPITDGVNPPPEQPTRLHISKVLI